eukprot:m.478210 g.478210  ORF g.478210 m.478210 type:complete len:547 (-) comp21076_c0_seq1:296-1936(-)
MAMHVPRSGLQNMMKDGAQHMQGLEEAVYRNINACKELSHIVRTSFGPNGMNKMIVNHLDKLFVTNDAATIIKELDVQHPAAKLLILASQQQEHEAGDGTNFVIMFAGKLLEKSETLLRMGLSTAEVIEGYEKAHKKAVELLPEQVCYTLKDSRDKEEVAKTMRTAIASKQFGFEDFITQLVTEACVSIIPEGSTTFNVDNVRVVKIPGCGVLSSTVLKGMVFHRKLQGGQTHALKARIAVYTCAVDTIQTETKGTVLIKSATELKQFSKGEEELLEAQIVAIKEAGANVVVTNGKVGDMALHFLERHGMMAVKLTSKYDLRRLCRTVGATALPRLTPPAPNELGACDEIKVEEIGDTQVTIFRQLDEASLVSSIIVRGATDNIMDDIERAVDDGVNTYKTMTRDGRFVPGAGATDMELAHQLQKYAETIPGLEQYAMHAFAESLEIGAHTLAENAGAKAQEVISQMYAAHDKGLKTAGFDNEGEDGRLLLDAAEKGIVDCMSVKQWALKYATEAATTVLRVDQIIMAKPAGGPKPRTNPNYDEDD